MTCPLIMRYLYPLISLIRYRWRGRWRGRKWTSRPWACDRRLKSALSDFISSQATWLIFSVLLHRIHSWHMLGTTNNLLEICLTGNELSAAASSRTCKGMVSAIVVIYIYIYDSFFRTQTKWSVRGTLHGLNFFEEYMYISRSHTHTRGRDF